MAEQANIGITVSGLTSGASDAIRRLGVVHDVMRHYLPGATFYRPDYNNYHCPDLDFFQLFGLYDLFDVVDETRFVNRVEISMSALADLLVARQFQPMPDTLYVIKADLYFSVSRARDARLELLYERDGWIPDFMSQLTYRSDSQPFAQCENGMNVTVHMRRRDICAELLFEGPGLENPLPQIQLVNRPTLSIQEAVGILEQRLPQGTAVNMVLTSDGYDWLRKVYRNHPQVLEQIEKLDQDLMTLPQSDHLSITLCARYIGGTAQQTRQTLDAMAHSDLVISRSSSFALLPCMACGVERILA